MRGQVWGLGADKDERRESCNLIVGLPYYYFPLVPPLGRGRARRATADDYYNALRGLAAHVSLSNAGSSQNNQTHPRESRPRASGSVTRSEAIVNSNALTRLTHAEGYAETPAGLSGRGHWATRTGAALPVRAIVKLS